MRDEETRTFFDPKLCLIDRVNVPDTCTNDEVTMDGLLVFEYLIMKDGTQK